MAIDTPDPKLGYNASNSGSDDMKPAILVDDAQAKATQKVCAPETASSSS